MSQKNNEFREKDRNTVYYDKYRCVIAWREPFRRETTEHDERTRARVNLSGTPFEHSWNGIVCGGCFKRSLAEWIILFHGGANTSITATRILSGLRCTNRVSGVSFREERREGEAEQPACSPVPDVKLFRDSRSPEKSSMRRTRPWSESRMCRFSVAEITRRLDLRPSRALSMNE